MRLPRAIRPPCQPMCGRQAFVKEDRATAKGWLLPLGVFAGGVLFWALLSALRLYPESAFPSPGAVAVGFAEEIRSGRLFDDMVASLFRVTAGYLLAILLSVP